MLLLTQEKRLTCKYYSKNSIYISNTSDNKFFSTYFHKAIEEIQ